MRQAVRMLLLLVFVGLREPVRADPDFLTLARNAIGDPATLARVHGLYQLVNIRRMGAGGMAMPSMEARMSRRPVPTAMWLAPPSRYLVRQGSRAVGFDGDRLIDVNVVIPPDWRTLTARFRHWALALLLYDPGTLGVAVHDLGTSQVGKKQLHILDATADHFEMRLYFDPKSNRLVMSEESFDVTELSGTGGVSGRQPGPPPIPPLPTPGPSVQVAERDTFGSYRRIGGIELPFSITRTRNPGGVAGTVTIQQDVVKYVINPSDLYYQFLHP